MLELKKKSFKIDFNSWIDRPNSRKGLANMETG